MPPNYVENSSFTNASAFLVAQHQDCSYWWGKNTSKETIHKGDRNKLENGAYNNIKADSFLLPFLRPAFLRHPRVPGLCRFTWPAENFELIKQGRQKRGLWELIQGGAYLLQGFPTLLRVTSLWVLLVYQQQKTGQILFRTIILWSLKGQFLYPPGTLTCPLPPPSHILQDHH